MPDEQLGRVRGAQHLVDEAIDLGVAKGVDVGEPLLLFGEPLAERAGGVHVIEDVPPRLDLHLEVGDGERPRAERLRETALEVEVPQEAAGVLVDAVLAAELARLGGKAVGIGGAPLCGCFTLLWSGHDNVLP